MVWFIVGVILLVLNLGIGIDDVQKGRSTGRAAFTWFVVGFMTWNVLYQLPDLL
jgi:hypothetical protein